ncbi:Formylglycine-generating enzyme, required for sulfatase activity, contains SUMF1/FGE domain [Alkalispirochaeta americana]|uniref:Formylglycine-generating enzyme, required for sulfatase activity, contains SUMF1/FGE domain n=1 Tax=Alkalispirochaeta americana TaxID=159291 RepID=A0A1N6WE67_9SPIO|nr:SUMF1/EgtB/PvdO family nonheme iron enzyme [Alkalispirochaeta americana]SIQ88374.1 Formylglycine-generating enzyme, required for sulfatase activity, contains SUMF1/FGE domain [Alkalispirochaeta americana]
MYRSYRHGIVPAVLIGVTLVLAGCQNPFKADGSRSSPSPSGGSLTVSLETSLVSGATILPEIEMEIEAYRVRVNGPGPVQSNRINSSRTTVTFSDLAQGDWTVTVKAENSDGVVVAYGSATVEVESGATAKADVALYPLEGSGTLNIFISWPQESLDSPVIEASLVPAGGSEHDISGSFVISPTDAEASYTGLWDTGYYTLNLLLKDGDHVAWPLHVAVRIIEGEESSGVFPLTEDDLLIYGEAPPPPGAILVNLGGDLNNPYNIALDGLVENIDHGEVVTIEMTLDPASEPDEIRWYLNGMVIPGETGRSLRIGPSGVASTPGTYWLSLVVSRGTMISSRRVRFEVNPVGPYRDLSDIDFREMVSVPGGVFRQRSEGEQNSFDHSISSFEIARYQVTYELWYTVRRWAEDNGYGFARPGREGSRGRTGGQPTAQGRHEPVTMISWRDAIVWMNAYSEMSGLSPVYYEDPERTRPIRDSRAGNGIQGGEGAIDNPYLDRSAGGYRLPTEGEWQYGASYQDGTNWTPHNYASGARADHADPAATGAVAWHAGNSDTGEGKKTQPVGTKEANQLGIHDMSGNVWEWVWDWRAEYPGESQVDYRGPSFGGARVLRGVGWDDTVPVTVGFRHEDYPWNARGFGVRPARTVDLSYGIGDFGPAGGRIAYVDEADDFPWTYLEAAPAGTEWSGKPWGGYATEVGLQARGTAVGTGASNTAEIVHTFGDVEPRNNRSDYAARLAHDLIVERNGTIFDDWFLPSRDELNLMYENLHAQGLGGFGDVNYWSSSEISSLDAWRQSFDDGDRGELGKSQIRRVRAARVF